jgi:acetylornithine deacetylase/succinyl-diaminopimelate desuccinylase-like protein
MFRFILVAMAAILSVAPANAQTTAQEAAARDVYAHIVGFRTAEGHKRTPAMVAYLTDVLTLGGVPASDITTLDLGEARAMIVRVSGEGHGRPILFSAHMDVVDARPEEWERNPFELIEENGRFYGRGTTDNKAGVAAMVYTILRMHAEGLRPARDLVFGFVADEEPGGWETTKLIAAHLGSATLSSRSTPMRRRLLTTPAASR